MKNIFVFVVLIFGACLQAMDEESKQVAQPDTGVLRLLSEQNRSFLKKNHAREDLEIVAQSLHNTMHKAYKELIAHDVQHPRGADQSVESCEQREELEREYMFVLLHTVGGHYRGEYKWHDKLAAFNRGNMRIWQVATIAMPIVGGLAMLLAALSCR